MTQADSNTEYAYWTASDSSFTVTYSLAVFHEIDFQVSEGFRRIPHGGIETGGLLFGTRGSNSPKIEAFRTIECEHASGPSFNLSERDVAQLREQLSGAAADSELAGLEVLGWFVAHTRSPLQMNDRETALFNELFPEPGGIMLLVKPERFQPTRFGFIVRGADGRFARDATPNAIILPLPGRAGRAADVPTPSIPAPVQRAAVPKPPPPKPPSSKPASPASPPPPVSPPAPAVEPPPVDLPPSVPPRTPVPEAAAPSFWRDVPVGPQREEPIVRIQEPPPAESDETKALTVLPSSRGSGAAASGALPSIEEIRRRRSEKGDLLDAIDRRAGTQRVTRKMRPDRKRTGLQLVSVLLLAAGLGCGVGYVAYLQLPSATIPLTITRQQSTLLVSWPAEQTRDAVSAAIRVNDGETTPLSVQQGAIGEALVPALTDSVKIELVAHHRLRDSRGIVRYVRANGGGP